MKLPIQAQPIIRKISAAKISFNDSLGVISQSRAECFCDDSNSLLLSSIRFSATCSRDEDCPPNHRCSFGFCKRV